MTNLVDENLFRENLKSAWLIATIMKHIEYDDRDNTAKLRREPLTRGRFINELKIRNFGDNSKNAGLELIEDGTIDPKKNPSYSRFTTAYKQYFQKLELTPEELLKQKSNGLYRQYIDFCTWLNEQPRPMIRNTGKQTYYPKRAFYHTDTVSVGNALRLTRQIVSDPKQRRLLQDALIKTSKHERTK